MRTLVVLLVMLPLMGQPANAQPRAQKAQAIDAKTVAAYEKLGAV
jgi:hypothetical protein